MVLEAMYEGYDLLYENLFGAVADVQEEVGAHSHTFTLANVVKPGLTVVADRDEAQAFQYDGVTLGQAVFRADVDKILRTSYSTMGHDETPITPPSKVYPPEQPVLHSEMACEIDDAPVDIRSFEVTMNENRDAVIEGSLDRLSSSNRFEPVSVS
jgi:hypothetical protein